MRAKSFFYVCAGLFLLALGYHLGATNATAQSPGGIEAAAIHENENTSAVIGRQLWYWHGVAAPPALMTSAVIPGSAAVIACGGDSGAGYVLLENGEEWKCSSGGSWTLVANWPVGSTPARQESWGGVKARYR
jgi:hypothetical protein